MGSQFIQRSDRRVCAVYVKELTRQQKMACPEQRIPSAAARSLEMRFLWPLGARRWDLILAVKNGGVGWKWWQGRAVRAGETAWRSEGSRVMREEVWASGAGEGH